jgi:hypothetical protein
MARSGAATGALISRRPRPHRAQGGAFVRIRRGEGPQGAEQLGGSKP